MMTGKRIVGRLAGVALATTMLAAVPAAAHERGFVAFGFSAPLAAPPVYYPPPRVVYAPPPVVYAPPPPVYVYPAPVVAYPAYPAYPAYGSISLGFGFSGRRR